MATERADD